MNKKLNDKQIEESLANSKATLALEGFEVKKHEVETVRKYLKGEYTEKEVVEIIKQE